MPQLRGQREGHIPALDGVRGVAILLVMLFHFALEIDRHSPFWDGLRSLFGFGWSGVDLFFVLSGFLITGILLDTKTAENYFLSFYARRFLRIFPAYYFALLALMLAAWLTPALAAWLPPHGDWRVYVAYLQNWPVLLAQPAQALVGHLWSLAVEEQFYLVWPLVIFALSTRAALITAAALSLGALSLRLVLIGMGVDSESIYRNTFSRLDALLIGAIIAIAVRDPRVPAWVRPRAKLLVAAGCGLLAFVPVYARSLSNHSLRVLGLGMTLIAAAYGLFLLTLVASPNDSPWRRRWSAPGLRMLGKYSYGMYLVHPPAYHLVRYLEERLGLPSTGPWNIPLAIGATLLIALLSFHLLESPFLAMKGRFRANFSPKTDPAGRKSASLHPSAAPFPDLPSTPAASDTAPASS